MSAGAADDWTAEDEGLRIGPSSRGWSYYGTFRLCPRLFAYKYRMGLPSGSKAALLGVLVHALLERHYKGILHGKFFPDDDAAGVAPTFAEKLGIADQAERAMWIFRNYRMHWLGERMQVLGVEREVRTEIPDGRGGHVLFTAILDLEHQEAPPGTGVWITDHKTAMSISKGLRGLYAMHGQIHGLIQFGMQEYGKRFRGVQLNFLQTDENKKPDFARVAPEIAPRAVQEFPQTVLDTAREIEMWDRSGRPPETWVKTSHEQVCYGKYGRCAFFDRCRGV